MQYLIQVEFEHHQPEKKLPVLIKNTDNLALIQEILSLTIAVN